MAAGQNGSGVTIRRTRAGMSLVAWLMVLVLLGGGAWAAYSFLPVFQSSDTHADVLFRSVERDNFELAITERGEIESVGDAEVRSEVKTQNSPGLAILRLVPEGTRVEKGDFLVELDSSALQDEKTTQQIAVNTAKAALVEAQNLYETAVIAKQEYLEGVYVQERTTIEGEVFVAEEDLSRAQEYLQYSRKLADKGYISEQMLEADAFAVENARKVLEAAKTKLRVLDEFTKAKMVKQLGADIMIGQAKLESAENSYELELSKLREIEDQIAKCIITAPRNGVVKYAHVNDRRGEDDFIVEEGAEIRERQTIIRLPDNSKMQVELTVNEALVQFVSEGLPAAIRPVGFDDMVLRGRVARVNQYAEPSGWRRANVKEYKAFVEILSEVDALRPGMTASVTIEALSAPSALQAPVQAVYQHGEDFYCFVQDGAGLRAQKVTLGPTNDRFFVIEEGLSENDRVAMNPRELLSRVELPEVARKEPVGPGAPVGDPTDSPDGEQRGPESEGAPAVARTAPDSDNSAGG